MLLLFGLRTRDHLIATRVMPCEVCGYSAPQALVQRTTKFTLFFVPLFPVRPSRSYLECGHCRAFRPVDSDVAGRLGTGHR
jgi:zinc-ribbon family